MNQERDIFYLTFIARAIQRLATRFDKQDLLNDFHLLQDELVADYAPIIDEAESLASGIYNQERSIDIPATSMTSMLAFIGNSECGMFHYTPKVVSLTKDCFPKKGKEQKAGETHFVNQLQANIKNLQKDNPHVLADNLLQLLYRYASFIPANGQSPDVSLYDQTRVASAIGICLYDTLKEQPLNPEKPMLLIGADFSGIQSYIYQIVSKHAGKNLKGRSFYLRLLSDAVLGCLIKRLNLYNANIIYDSGGCFYLLAPNTRTVKDAFEDAVGYIEKQMFQSHQTSLYVAIECIEVSKEEIGNLSSAN
jgi:CRISPR-associated protein Csm1